MRGGEKEDRRGGRGMGGKGRLEEERRGKEERRGCLTIGEEKQG